MNYQVGQTVLYNDKKAKIMGVSENDLVDILLDNGKMIGSNIPIEDISPSDEDTEPTSLTFILEEIDRKIKFHRNAQKDCKTISEAIHHQDERQFFIRMKQFIQIRL